MLMSDGDNPYLFITALSREKRRRGERRPLIRFIRMNPERSALDTNW